MPVLQEIKNKIEALSSPEKAEHLKQFFKTAPGQYGSGDLFRGINVPPLRAIAKEYAAATSPTNYTKLLYSKYHEDRMVALFILVEKFKAGDQTEKKTIYDFYTSNLKYINNWDLVDLSCHHIVGDYLLDKKREDLYRLANRGSGESHLKPYQQKDLWANRIAIVSTFAFIRVNDFDDTLKLAELLLDNKHDLIHKATGWMIREVGKRDMATEETFLQKNYKNMPRTMLRYAIEKFTPERRQQYLKGLI